MQRGRSRGNLGDGASAPCLICLSGNPGLEARAQLKMSFPNEVGFRFSIVFVLSDPSLTVPLLCEQPMSGSVLLTLPTLGWHVFSVFEQSTGTR